MIKEIKANKLNTAKFISQKVNEIKNAVGKGLAINALSGGVDSSVKGIHPPRPKGGGGFRHDQQGKAVDAEQDGGDRKQPRPWRGERPATPSHPPLEGRVMTGRAGSQSGRSAAV